MHQYARYVPLGLMLWSPFSVDPYFIDDFEKERAFVYVLEGDEIELVENL
jgi:hypothetical protein